MKLFSCLRLNITFLQDFSRSTGTSLLSDLVIDLPLPHLLSISFPRYRLALRFFLFLLNFFESFPWLVAKRCFVSEWPQGLSTRLLWNENTPSALDVGVKSLSHYLGENNWHASASGFFFIYFFVLDFVLVSVSQGYKGCTSEWHRGTVPTSGH